MHRIQRIRSLGNVIPNLHFFMSQYGKVENSYMRKTHRDIDVQIGSTGPT